MRKIPVSPKGPRPAWPRAGAPDYAFTVRSYGGRELGVDLHELDSTFVVDSRQSLVSVESFRSEGDQGGQLIGVFRLKIDDQKARELRELIDAVKLFGPLPSMDRHPSYTQRAYQLLEPLGERQDPRGQVINDSHTVVNHGQLAPLRKAIGALFQSSLAHPERAARAGITRAHQPGGEVFEVTLTNVGSEKICFTDPRWIVATGPLQQAVVKIAEFPEQVPGESEPLEWKTIPLPAMDGRPQKEPLVTLDAGGVWKAKTAPYKTIPGKRYLAYFTWAHYPGAPVVDGVYRIRGRTDSERLVFAP